MKNKITVIGGADRPTAIFLGDAKNLLIKLAAALILLSFYIFLLIKRVERRIGR